MALYVARKVGLIADIRLTQLVWDLKVLLFLIN
jgi:hypothetical protein